jgi:ssDNA-binding Zn-finger/Zn-ribbon topoisomerase 1
MNLGQLIKGKILNRKEDIKKDMLSKEECNRCGLYTDIKELEYNSQFPLYNNKRICDSCADKIETRADLEL